MEYASGVTCVDFTLSPISFLEALWGRGVLFKAHTRGLGWRMHCGAEDTESSTNKQHHHVTRSAAASAGAGARSGGSGVTPQPTPRRRP